MGRDVQIKKEEVIAKMEQMIGRPLGNIERMVVELTILRDVAMDALAYEKMSKKKVLTLK